MEQTLKSWCGVLKSKDTLPHSTPETVITFDRWDAIISEVQAYVLLLLLQRRAEGDDNKVERKGLFSKGLLARVQIFNYRKAFLWINDAIRPESSEHNHYYCISIAWGP